MNPLKIALPLMAFGCAFIMAIPVVGPILLASL